MSKHFQILLADRCSVRVEGDGFYINGKIVEVYKDHEVIASFPEHDGIFEWFPPKPDPLVADTVRCGLLFRWSSLWVGAHYSPYNRRWCINLVPCVTLWITLKGGRVPSKEH